MYTLKPGYMVIALVQMEGGWTYLLLVTNVLIHY